MARGLLSPALMQIEGTSMVPAPWRGKFSAARAALCADDVAVARPLFEAMAAAVPDNAEIRLYAAWTEARLAESSTDAERERLESLARDALGGGRALALPLCILGHGAVRRGDLCVARMLFRRAADADPALVDARRGCRLVERRLRRSRAGATLLRRTVTATTRCALALLVPAGLALLVATG